MIVFMIPYTGTRPHLPSTMHFSRFTQKNLYLRTNFALLTTSTHRVRAHQSRLCSHSCSIPIHDISQMPWLPRKTRRLRTSIYKISLVVMYKVTTWPVWLGGSMREYEPSYDCFYDFTCMYISMLVLLWLVVHYIFPLHFFPIQYMYPYGLTNWALHLGERRF